jgi:hypothetical protein
MLRSITGWIVLLVFGSVALADPSAARPALAMRLPEVKFESVSLSGCIDFYRDVSDANIHVNWRALESIGIGRDMPVTLDLRAVSLRTALRLTLSQTDPANMTAVYIDEGVIEITTRDIADAQLITRTYFVDDLLMVIPDFYGPDLNLESSQSTGSRSSGGSGDSSRGSIFDDNDQDDEEITTKAERADELISLIQEIVQPNVWRDNGGVATIRYFNGNLIVTAPRSVHEAIGGPIQ